MKNLILITGFASVALLLPSVAPAAPLRGPRVVCNPTFMVENLGLAALPIKATGFTRKYPNPYHCLLEWDTFDSETGKLVSRHAEMTSPEYKEYLKPEEIVGSGRFPGVGIFSEGARYLVTLKEGRATRLDEIMQLSEDEVKAKHPALHKSYLNKKMDDEKNGASLQNVIEIEFPQKNDEETQNVADCLDRSSQSYALNFKELLSSNAKTNSSRSQEQLIVDKISIHTTGNTGRGGPYYSGEQSCNTMVSYILKNCLGHAIAAESITHQYGRLQGKPVSIPGWGVNPDFPGNEKNPMPDLIYNGANALKISEQELIETLKENGISPSKSSSAGR